MLKVNYDQIYGYPDTLTVEEAQLSVYGETQETAVYNVQQLSSADYLPYDVDVDYQGLPRMGEMGGVAERIVHRQQYEAADQ